MYRTALAAWVLMTYAGRYNHVREHSGHLYQGRFKSFLIEKEAYFAEVLRYVRKSVIPLELLKR